MPRQYKRKCPDRKTVTQEQIDKAKKLLEKGYCKRKAAEVVGISESVLRKRLKLDTVSNSLGRFKPTFSESQEKELLEHCLKMDQLFYELTVKSLGSLAFQFAEMNKIQHRFDKDLQMARCDWVKGFLKRHPGLCIRQSMPTSLARASAFNKNQVDRFYQNLESVNEESNI